MNTKLNPIKETEHTKLYTHNVDVDKINQNNLDELKVKSFTSEHIKSGDESLCNLIISQRRIPETFEYKVGAWVMFTKNHPDLIYCNGTCGVITEIFGSEKIGFQPVVRVKNGNQLVAELDTWRIIDIGLHKRQSSLRHNHAQFVLSCFEKKLDYGINKSKNNKLKLRLATFY